MCWRSRRSTAARHGRFRPPKSATHLPPRPPLPVVADFLRHALEEYRFAPTRPASEIDFKRAYAKVAGAAGLTSEQAVRVYAFEVGGNGKYDTQAGLEEDRLLDLGRFRAPARLRDAVDGGGALK